MTITLASSDETEGKVAPGTLVFDSTNWNSARTVTVTGVDDSEIDGDVPYTVYVESLGSSDSNYATVDITHLSVACTNKDNEAVFGRYTGTASFVDDYDELSNWDYRGAPARGTYTVTVTMVLQQVAVVYNLKGTASVDVTISKTPTGGWGVPESRHLVYQADAQGFTTSSGGTWSYGGIDSHLFYKDDPNDPYYDFAIHVNGSFNSSRTAVSNGHIQVNGNDLHPLTLTKVSAILAGILGTDQRRALPAAAVDAAFALP